MIHERGKQPAGFMDISLQIQEESLMDIKTMGGSFIWKKIFASPPSIIPTNDLLVTKGKTATYCGKTQLNTI